ncbi:MAG: aminotransferase class III-fold pyridoxal phosphate-dependent enzyme [Thermoanaerobaculia bacterium]|nr:aminotransferase class III-fold pyridoxal phosphate-dependent enzyme [Thermoanaerobaculia bacterium]
MKQTSSTEAIIVRHDAFLAPNYVRYPIALVRGEGSRLWDAEGKEFIDLFAGFGAPLLGHCHPDLVAALTDQAHKLWHAGATFHTEPQTHLAEAISRHGFGGKSFFSHSRRSVFTGLTDWLAETRRSARPASAPR